MNVSFSLLMGAAEKGTMRTVSMDDGGPCTDDGSLWMEPKHSPYHLAWWYQYLEGLKATTGLL